MGALISRAVDCCLDWEEAEWAAVDAAYSYAGRNGNINALPFAYAYSNSLGEASPDGRLRGGLHSLSHAQVQRIGHPYYRPVFARNCPEWPSRTVRRLVEKRLLAPIIPGTELEDCKTDVECPICYMFFPLVNETVCCHQAVCTECFVLIQHCDLSSPERCPYCMHDQLRVRFSPPPVSIDNDSSSCCDSCRRSTVSCATASHAAALCRKGKLDREPSADACASSALDSISTTYTQSSSAFDSIGNDPPDSLPLPSDSTLVHSSSSRRHDGGSPPARSNVAQEFRGFTYAPNGRVSPAPTQTLSTPRSAMDRMDIGSARKALNANRGGIVMLGSASCSTGFGFTSQHSTSTVTSLGARLQPSLGNGGSFRDAVPAELSQSSESRSMHNDDGSSDTSKVASVKSPSASAEHRSRSSGADSGPPPRMPLMLIGSPPQRSTVAPAFPYRNARKDSRIVMLCEKGDGNQDELSP